MKLYIYLAVTIFSAIILSTDCKAQWLQYDKALNPKDSNVVRSSAKAISVLNNGKIVGAFLGGLFEFNNGLWESYLPDSLPISAFVFSMVKDTMDNLWVATSAGLKYYDTKLRKMTKYYSGKTWARDSSKLPGNTEFYNYVQGIAIDSSGGLWLSGMSNGFDLAYLKDGKWTLHTVVTYEEWARYGVIGESGSTSLEVEKNGTIWYASYYGIVRFDPKTGTRTFFDTLRIDNKIIVFELAGRIHIAGDGKIWLNAQTDYILNFDPRDSVWTVLDRKEIPSIRSDDDIRSIFCRSAAEDNQGNLWLTLHPDYLAQYNKFTGKWKKVQLPPGRYYDSGVKTFLEYGLAIDRKGQVWVGTFGEGFVVYTGDVSAVEETNEVQDTFAHTWIFSVAPNPVIHSARAQIFADPALRASLRVGIYSLQGELLCDVTDKVQIDAVSGHGTVELEPVGLPTGAYMLRVANGSDYHCTMIAVIK